MNQPLQRTFDVAVRALLLFFLGAPCNPCRYNSAIAATPPIADGLVAYYPLNGSAKDESAYHNDATPLNARLTTDQLGQADSAYFLDGANSLLQAPNQPYLTFPSGGDFTISIWAALNSFNEPVTFLIGMDNGSGDRPKWILTYGQLAIPGPLGFRDNYLHFNTTDGSGSGRGYFLACVPFTPELGTWHHYVVTKAGTTYTMYIDGLRAKGTNYMNDHDVLRTDVTGPASIVPGITAPLSIGWAEGPYTLDGKVDEVRIYNRALSDSEIAQLNGSFSPVSISRQPESVSAVAGENVVFRVEAAGAAPLSYQWKFNGVSIPGAASASLALNGVSSANAGLYSVDVSNVIGTVASAAATLNVLHPPAITLQPRSEQILAGTDAAFSVSASGSEPLSFQWSKNGVPVPGLTSRTYIIRAATLSDAGRYTVAITNPYGSITSAAAVLTIVFPPGITRHPDSISVFSGDGAAFTVEAAGTAPFSYQWFKDDAAIPDATNASLIIPHAFFGNAGVYTVAVSNPYGTQRSSPAVLTVKAVPNYVIRDETPGGGIVLRQPFLSSFPPNSTVTLTATPNDGWTFLDWKENAQGANVEKDLTVSYPKSFRARFGTSIALAPSGNGTLQVDPPASLYPYGTSVRLLARPAEGNYFAGWSGSVAGDANPLTMTVRDANAVVAGSFLPLPAGRAALSIATEGSGNVAVGPKGNHFAFGQNVTNTALPDPGQDFLGWSGDAQGTQNPLIVMMDRSKNITARFTQRPRVALRMSGQDGALLTVTGAFTGAHQILHSTDLVYWSPVVVLTNAYGEAQTMLPASEITSYFKAVENAPVGRKASAVATVVNGFVVAVAITDPGAGYIAAPDISISGGGAGAIAAAVIKDGQVEKINVLNAGSGYSGTPVISITPPAQ